MTVSPSSSTGSECRPSWATRRRPERASLGPQIAAVAEELGQPLMPWQRLVADVGGEVDGDGKPFYREVICTVPRQSGKTSLMLAWEIQRALGWGSPQQIAYMAQDGAAARRKLVVDQIPLLERSPLWRTVSKVTRSAADSSVSFVGGSRVDVLGSSESAGHGRTIDLAVMDEVFADHDLRREQALLPAMATRHKGQILVISTMGDEGSVLLNRKVESGRAAIAENVEGGTAFFEWSAPPDADIDDPVTWRRCMPALGHTINEDTVRHARLAMSEGDFRRAWLNQQTSMDMRVLPADLWAAVCRDDVAPDGGLRFGVDVNPDRSAAAIAVGDEEMRGELVEYRPGVGWLVDRVVELASRWGTEVVLDGYSPAASFADEMESRGVTVVRRATREVAAACGRLFDAVADQRVRVLRNPDLDRAAAVAKKRTTGDAWVWARRDSSDDVSPLVALTLALDHAKKQDPSADTWMFWD